MEEMKEPTGNIDTPTPMVGRWSLVDLVAQIAHEANRAYCQAIGDNSQPPWENAPEWQKSSARDGVENVMRGASPGDSHANWLRHKEADGWKYGETKDADKRTHPCMLPFEQLPPEQQLKDHLFIGVVRVSMKALEEIQ